MSSQYWRDRERDWKNRKKKTEKEQEEEIQEIYQNMLDSITKEIESFFSRYAAKEGISMAEAKKRVKQIEIEEYKRKAKKYVKEKDFSDKANEEMRLYNLTMKVNRLELLKANIGAELVNGTNDLETYYGDQLNDAVMEELERNVSILGPSVLNNAQSARAIIDSSFRNATYSERVWANQGVLRNNLVNIITAGIIQGKNARDLVPQLRKQFDVSRYQAERLLRTELTRARIQVQAESYKAEDIEKYEYIACGLRDCCPACKALDGKIFKVKDMEFGENAPPLHPNCHCATAPYSDRGVYEKWLDGLANGEHDLRFDEWKEQFYAINKVSSKLGDRKVYITEQAIDKVKQVEFEGLLDSVGLQELHRELLRKSMGDNDSNEVLTIVNVNDYNQKVITFGSERSVMPSKNIEALTMMQKSKYQSVYWLHNHGFTNEFSYNDLGCFYDERIKALTIVTNKGKIAVINKTKKYSVQKFHDIIIEERGKYENPIDHSDEIAQAILRRHNECGIQWIR
jgi:SPP1 gp7 family putative phage head morphogenesis protein